MYRPNDFVDIVLSGVPQGSVLAALLFMIFINDLPELMENIIKMYADDTKIIAKVGKESESETIQQDLNNCMVLVMTHVKNYKNYDTNDRK